MKRDFLIRSVEYFSERDYRDLQEALGQPGAAGVPPAKAPAHRLLSQPRSCPRRLERKKSAKKKDNYVGKSLPYRSNLRRCNIPIRDASFFPPVVLRDRGSTVHWLGATSCFLTWDYRPRPGFARCFAACNSLPNTLAAQSGIVCTVLLNLPPM